MDTFLPLPATLSIHAQRRAAYQAKRAANMKMWGIEPDGHSSIRTRSEQAEVDEQIVPQAPVVHRQVIEAAPTSDYDECLACQ